MKMMAVICEYNPFHKGHAYQLTKQKELLGCDGVIALMSGSFVQRGEPAVCDKWARAEMALLSGADLVFELPVVYSLQSAEGFATGAVKLLQALGIEGYLAFGSESADLTSLYRIAETGMSEAYQNLVKENLTTGAGYNASVQKALETLCPHLTAISQSPNDMLGVEYIRSIIRTKAKLTPKVIKREKGQHGGLQAEDGFLSATGIRTKLNAGEDVSPYMPVKAYEILEREMKAGRAPYSSDALDIAVLYALNRFDSIALSHICGMSEGLENRLISSLHHSGTYADILETCVTKRYSKNRISRAVMCALLGIQKEDAVLNPAYGRVLGINDRGSAILKVLKETSTVPIVTKTADLRLGTEEEKRMFALDIRSTDVYSLLYPDKKNRRSGLDFYRSPVIIKN